MDKVKVGELGDKDLTFHQCMTSEEAKEQGLPEGTHFFWEYDGKRMYSPGEVVSLVILHAQGGTLSASSLTTTKNIKEYYERLYKTQQQTALDSMKQMQEQLQGAPGIPPEVKKAAADNLKQTMELHQKNMPFPGMDGMFRPTKEQAAHLVGGVDKLNQMFTEEQQKNMFGE